MPHVLLSSCIYITHVMLVYICILHLRSFDHHRRHPWDQLDPWRQFHPNLYTSSLKLYGASKTKSTNRPFITLLRRKKELNRIKATMPSQAPSTSKYLLCPTIASMMHAISFICLIPFHSLFLLTPLFFFKKKIISL